MRFDNKLSVVNHQLSTGNEHLMETTGFDNKLSAVNCQLSTINNVVTDYRAEVVAAGLIETGYDPDKMLMFRKGSSRKFVAKDIHAIEYEYYDQELEHYLHISSNRPNIYDALPEGLFHKPVHARKRSKEDIIAEIQEQSREEREARRFFQPFEMAVDRMLIEAQLYERKFDKKNINRNLADIFVPYWPILKLFSLKQAAFFIKVIPLISGITNNFEVMSQIITVILEAPVTVKIGKKRKIHPAAANNACLGSYRLGLNMALNREFEDGYRNVDIVVGPVEVSQMKAFEYNNPSDLILKALLKMMLPFDTTTRIRYETAREQADFRLSDTSRKTYLGINTRLGNGQLTMNNEQ